MTVEVQLFAAAREAVGADAVTVAAPDGASFAELAAAIVAEHPQLGDLIRVSRFASNGEYAPPTQAVDPAGEVALIPPVSGG